MTLTEYAQIIQKQIEIRYQPNLDLWQCKLAKADVKYDGLLGGEYGSSRNINESISDYCEKIRGKTLVFNSHSGDRQELGVPMSLTNK